MHFIELKRKIVKIIVCDVFHNCYLIIVNLGPLKFQPSVVIKN